MRIGGGIQKEYNNPEEWLRLVKECGYSTVITPVGNEASREDINTYTKICRDNNIIIGEVGIWKNPLSPVKEEAQANIEYSKKRLALAEEIGANCCVNIVGARGEVWDGGYEDNYSEDVYALIIDITREIIDAVNPKRTFFTLEPMPWMVPDSPDSYLKLLHDIDRKGFAVHLDFTNMINCPERYIKRDRFIEECFRKLGPYIKSVHAKDVIMERTLPCIIHEVMPGKGAVDFKKVLRLCEGLGKDTTVFVEHLNTHEEYIEAAGYMRQAAKEAGVEVI